MAEKPPRPLANYVFIVLIALALFGALEFTVRMGMYATTGGMG
ncbi:MAG TPA: hypothetical protein VMU93_04785 [Caulobacteraceae bacterium]|nr:hypothetical protein [Caulobacteraceae bacterium]